jgi:hypothetical protein
MGYLVVLVLQDNDHEAVKVLAANQLVVVARGLMAMTMRSRSSRDSGSQCEGNGSDELDGDHNG